jgi:hypothetical protein
MPGLTRPRISVKITLAVLQARAIFWTSSGDFKKTPLSICAQRFQGFFLNIFNRGAGVNGTKDFLLPVVF